MDRLHAATEIEFFKAQPFADIAAALGYTPDGKASSGGSTVLRREDGDKVAVKRDGKHWVYFSVHDRTDHGSIVDFIQRRTGGTLGDVRKALRDITGHNGTFILPTAPNPGQDLPPSSTVATDPDGFRKKSLAVWNAATWNPEHPYLLSRGLDHATLADFRFANTFRQDAHGNAVFPNYDRGGLCGYERRGPAVKMFGKDVKKGLWVSANLKNSYAIIITESAIDALSHSRLYADAYYAYYAYCAIGGAIGSRQRDLLAGLLAKAGDRNALVVIATDNDAAGDSFYNELSVLAPMRLERHRPIDKDWNADLAYCNREQGGTSWS